LPILPSIGKITPTMANLFVYGTLLNSEIQLALTGQMFIQKDFLLKGFSRYRIFDGPVPLSYPALVEDKKGSVKGKILFDLSEQSLNILDYYENKEYIRKEILLDSGKKKIAAFVYIWAPENKHELKFPWDLKEFEQHFLCQYLEEIIPAALSEYQMVTGS
jgi:gamma-glutamylcyclotransferase (GGCT)/AIG2-like uncharacterized protein YtfP